MEDDLTPTQLKVRVKCETDLSQIIYGIVLLMRDVL